MEKQLKEILDDLSKVSGIDGSLIVDGDGNVLCHHMLEESDVSLFGSMAHVITSSSKRLLNAAEQGKIERVLVESREGKVLFLHLGNVNFIVLMESGANLGLVMISAKKAANKIVRITADLFPIVSEELEVPPEIPPEKVELEEEKVEIQHEVEIKSESAEIQAGAEVKAEEVEIQHEAEMEVESAEAQVEEPSVHIPVIKPPISFPELPKDVKVPEGSEERSNLILDIYEAIFLAMSIGASKIMGVAPARGMTKKFLPVESCQKLLDGVSVKSNSTVDFDKIRENAQKIPSDERENEFITDFSKIIHVITEGYGKVMGYDAFRGMVRAEFKMIDDSFGESMEKLGIKEKIHPELAILFK